MCSASIHSKLCLSETQDAIPTIDLDSSKTSLLFDILDDFSYASIWFWMGFDHLYSIVF